jgi:hypothetical protein
MSSLHPYRPVTRFYESEELLKASYIARCFPTTKCMYSPNPFAGGLYRISGFLG